MHFINNTIKYFLIVLFVFSFGKVVPQSCPGSLLLDANNLAVDLPSTNQYYSGTNSGYTWECWFKLNQPFGTDMRPLICALDGVLFEDQWLGFGWQGGWFNEPVTRLVFKVDGPSSAFPTGPNCSYEPIGGFVIGTWYHAAGVMDYANQIAKLYVNGVLVDSKPIITPPITRVIPTQLGLNFGGTIMPLYGNMDEVRIWTRVLSASEIASNYDKCLSGSEPNLFLYYRCNQPGGSNVLDATINNNTGTFSNAPSWSTQQPVITGTACASSPSSFSVNLTSICQANSTANVTATVSSNAISPTFSYSWTNSSGIVVSQTNNTTTFSNTVSNLANGLYTLTAQMNTACGTVTSLTKTLSINCTSSLTIPPCKGIMTGTGMSICNQYSFSITPSQTITPFNYGSQGYACTGATMPDVSFNILGPAWRVMKNNWFFQSSVAGEIRGYTSSGVMQTIPFSPSQTITPLSYSGTLVQFAINGVATGSLVNQATYSISLTSSLHSSNNYTYCPTSNSVAISPNVPSQGGPWTYSWQPGGFIGNPINVNPQTNTIYTVTATSNAGCVSTTSVNVSVNCPQPPLCSGNQGSFIFFEDFGSGTALYGPALPLGVTNYVYQQGVPGNGTYVIASSSNPSGTNAGYVNDNHDHTGNLNGYMMVVNSDYPAAEVYRKHVTGLCPSTTYVFCAYLANNNSPLAVSNVCGSSYVYANIKFLTEFPLGTVQGSVSSGNLQVAPTATSLPWVQYGFSFTTGPSQTSVDIVLKNNAPGGCGNDYVVDDISLAPCGPGVALNIVPNQTVFCIGDAINIQSNFTSGSYVNPQYQWQFSNDGGATWSNIIGATAPNYNISSLSSTQGGLYQLLVSENGNINSSSCRIIAGPIGFSIDPTCNSNSTSFSSPDTVCVNQSFSISNLSTGANSYYWTFCQGNTSTAPQAINLGNVGFFNGPVFITIAKDGSDYYAFVTNNSSSTLTKLFFGSSLLNVPVATNLGNISGAFPGSLEDIHIENEAGNWYGIAVGGFGGGESIIRINFGNSLANTPTAVNYGNIGGLNYPQRLKIFKNGVNYYGFTTNRNNNTVTRFSFGSSIANIPTGLNMGNIGALNTPDAIAIVNVASMWHGYIINEGNNTITRLDFGNSLLNIPTATNIGNTGALNGPRGIDMWTECNEVRGLITNRFSNDLLNMNLSSGPTGPVVTSSFGNIANFSFPHSITRFRSGDTLFAFITNVSNNTLSRIYYPGCVNSSIASSTLTNPPAISYNAPGNYYINLVTNEGQITQASYCKQVTVIASPTVTVSNANICAGSTASLTANGANSYSWTTSPSLSSSTGSLVITIPSVSESYTVTGFIGSCTNTAVSSVTIIPSPTITITPTLTSICSGQTSTLTAFGANTYTWNSSSTLSSNSGSLVVANPITSTVYTVTGTLNTCSSSATTTVNIVTTPTVTISSNTFICQGLGSATLIASGANTYTWANSASLSSPTGSLVVASPNTTSSYTVTGITGICSNTAAVTVSVNLSPTITAVSFTNTTCGLNNGAVTISSLPVANTYTWSSGISTISNSVSSLSAGNYTVSAFNGVCQVSTVVPISSSIPLQIITSNITGSDCGTSNGSISVTDNYSNSTYSWNPNVSVSNNITNLAPGTYSVLIANEACSTSSVFVVNQLNGPSSITVNQNNTICESTNGSISVTSVSNGVSPYQYSFDNSGYTSVNTFSNLAQGIYTITVKDANGCVYSNTYTIEKVTVTSNIELTKNFPTCNANDGSFVISNITGGTGPFLLSFNGLLFATDTIFEEVGPGSYSLVIRDSNLCETNLILEMPINKNDYTLYVPNTFTPNKDLLNDTWFAKATCINAFNCLIFNRWGEKIMELKDINEFWDGTYKGKNVPDGVYVYLIEAETNDGTIYKNGHITLFR